MGNSGRSYGGGYPRYSRHSALNVGLDMLVVLHCVEGFGEKLRGCAAGSQSIFLLLVRADQDPPSGLARAVCHLLHQHAEAGSRKLFGQANGVFAMREVAALKKMLGTRWRDVTAAARNCAQADGQLRA